MQSAIQKSLPTGVDARRHAFARKVLAKQHRAAIGRSSLKVKSVLDIEKSGIKDNGSIDYKPKSDLVNLEKDILKNAAFVVGTDPATVSKRELYEALAYSVRERLIESFNETHDYWKEKDPKFVYYLSAEFLMGRTLTNAIYNLGLEKEYSDALKQLGYSLEELQQEELDAALGNGGLGRLAACFIDSIATLDLPGWGYGIRYRYGMFKQKIDQAGFQKEVPDIWLTTGNPWEIPRPNITFRVGFYGELKDGKWIPAEEVIAQAYDNPIPGYNTKTTSNLRLWAAKPVEEFDLDAFNEGSYIKAVQNRVAAENIDAVLYPNDATQEGKELRLKQQYFFVTASLQDTIARFKESGGDLTKLADKAIFQLNDTHPTIAVAELMRLLVDVEGLDWDSAWAVTTKALAYTNHTVMPEALEKWPVAVMGKLLPRHLQIIEAINEKWLASIRPHVEAKVAAELAAAPVPPTPAEAEAEAAKEEEEEEEKPDPVEEALKPYSIIQENPWNKGEYLINMAYLAVVGTSAVNGVAAIHSEIIKEDIFPLFYELFPERFQNKTNGVTPRRWISECNPELRDLITETLGTDKWEKELDLLRGLAPYADDKEYQKKWAAIKRDNKIRMAAKIKELTGYDVPVDSMYDVQIKRIHEYKRQYMNVLSIIWRYHTIKTASPEERKNIVPRVCVFGGKAASAYYMAKKIVRLVNQVGAKVNNDPDVGDLLKVIFVPDYNVSKAEWLIPGAELSQHISTAGTEASGTSNMKFQMNGSLIIGTMDGANIEIAEESGVENLFIFGVDAKDINRLRQERRDFTDYDPRWVHVMKMIKDGVFGDADYFADLVDSVNDMTKGNDWFLLANDFASYMDAQDEVDKVYKDQDEWTRRSILMSAGGGKFSSDRTIAQYAKEIWNVEPTPLP